MRYITTSAIHRKAVLAALGQVGFLWHGTDKVDPDKIEQDFPWSDWPTLNIRVESKYISGSSSLDGSANVEAEFLKLISFSPVTVELSDRYTAVIHKDTEEVEVGCQKFPFSAVIELYRAIQ